MPARKSGDHPGPATTGSLTVDPPMVANVPSTVAVDGAPADTDVTFSVAQPSHGADETVVRADGSGHAETVVVPNGAGELTVAATVTVIDTLAVVTVDVSGSPYPEGG